MTEAANNAGDTKPCPVCGESIKVVAIKCRFCGEDLQKLQQRQEAEVERDLFVGHPPAVFSAGQWVLVVLTLGIAFIVYWVRSLSVTFHITTQRIRIERGLLSKAKENLELFRIDHYELHQPLGMRLLGHSVLHLSSSDKNVQELALYGIPNIESLADTLRECSLRERKRRAVTTFVNA